MKNSSAFVAVCIKKLRYEQDGYSNPDCQVDNIVSVFRFHGLQVKKGTADAHCPPRASCPTFQVAAPAGRVAQPFAFFAKAGDVHSSFKLLSTGVIFPMALGTGTPLLPDNLQNLLCKIIAAIPLAQVRHNRNSNFALGSQQ